MLFTLEVGTKVKLTLQINHETMNTDGIVVSRQFQVGNGIRFNGMATEENARLKRFLEAIP